MEIFERPMEPASCTYHDIAQLTATAPVSFTGESLGTHHSVTRSTERTLTQFQADAPRGVLRLSAVQAPAGMSGAVTLLRAETQLAELEALLGATGAAAASPAGALGRIEATVANLSDGDYLARAKRQLEQLDRRLDELHSVEERLTVNRYFAQFLDSEHDRAAQCLRRINAAQPTIDALCDRADLLSRARTDAADAVLSVDVLRGSQPRAADIAALDRTISEMEGAFEVSCKATLAKLDALDSAVP
jgi:hypothetical protein